jgi:peptidoglycan/xylan/chitin deacetylase (PgdA/CDA1 family)
MTDRSHLRRAGAIALGALAVAALAQSMTLTETPQPVLDAATRPARLAATGDSERQPAAPAPTAVVPPGRPAVRVPILMYHYIRVNPDPRDRLGFNLSVTPADFAQQMDWLAANGFHPVDFDDLRAYLLGHDALPARPVVLTFDDGYRDLYTTAYPVLRAHRFKAVAYVVAGFVGRASNVTADQVLEMDANGIQIGAHSVSHADLTRISAADLQHEVFDSKAMLEGLLGHPVLDFCYPSGRVDDAVVRTVAAAGFQTATTTQPGVVHTAADRFLWTRVRVSGGEPLPQLVADLGQPEPVELATPPPPPPTPLHGPTNVPLILPLRPPPEALRAGPPTEGPLP